VRIVVDAYQAAAHVTGTDRQARNALAWLQRIDPSNEYRVVVNKEFDFVGRAIRAPNFTTVPIAVVKRASWVAFGLPFLLRRLDADAFFSFHNLSGPLWKVCPTVLSALDLVPFLHRKTYFRSLARRLFVLGTMRAAVRRADQVVANSEFTRESVIDYFGLSRDRVVAAPLQADDVFLAEVAPDRLRRCRETYRVAPGFVLGMGGSEPRKNVARLIEAHRSLPREVRAAHPLCIAGARWQGRELATGDDPHVRALGVVAEDDLPALYRLAGVFAFPSLYEGFGLPVLEAMASGTPVLTANTTALPSVAGGAALLVEPTSVPAIARALETLLADAGCRARLVAAGRARVAAFSWQRNAEQIVAAIDRAVAGA
jgi:glycosyltransferase involved in cell wall biosynthesis